MNEILEIIKGFVPAIAILVSCLITVHFNRQITNNIKKSQRTKQLIDEFFSADFNKHRKSLWITKTKVQKKTVSMNYITKGFIYPLDGDYYDGVDIHGFSEHQHITIYLGFFQRLAYSIEHNEVEKEYLKKALGYPMLWQHDFFLQMKESGEKLKNDKITTPYFIESIKIISDFFSISYTNGLINEITEENYKLLENEEKPNQKSIEEIQNNVSQ